MGLGSNSWWVAATLLFSKEPLPFEESRKRLLFGAAGSFTALVLTGFAFVRLLEAHFLLAFINGFGAALLLLSIWLAYRTDDAGYCYKIFALVGAILISISASRGDPESYRMLWLYVYVPVVFFLLGSKEGLVFALVPSCAWVLAMFVPTKFSGPEIYGTVVSSRFLLTLTLLVSVSWYFETVRGMYSKTALERHLQLENDREEMQSLAFSDELTGLPNRRSVIHFVDDSLAALSYDDSKTAMVALLDIDHFKVVNDNHGHNVGDDVLIEVSKRISGAIRSADFVGRFGGEEFVVVLPSEASTRYREIVENIRLAVGETPIIVDSLVLQVTVSIGAARLLKDLTRDQVIDQADKALYAAKQNGRNQSLFYGEEEYSVAVSQNLSEAS